MSRETCESFRSAIAAGSSTLPVTIHLFTCADCRAYRRSISRMNHVVRRTPRPVPPPLVALPDALPLSPRGVERRSFVIRSLVGGLAAAAAVGLGVFVGPRFLPSASFAADVRQAIAHANTWHFSGWRLVEGKRVPWEIWGRRTPFFYREQVGDNLLITDETHQLRIVPPGDHRPQGVALTLGTPQDRKTAALTQTPESFIAGIGGEFIGRLKPVGKQGNEVFLQSPIATSVGARQMDDQGLLTVDADSKLPIHYQLKRAVHQEIKDDVPLTDRPLPVENSWTQAELTVQYNVPIPDAVTTADSPDNYAQVNLLKPTTISGPGTASANGITVQGNAIAQDSEGNLHIRFDGWFGQEKHHEGLPLQLSVQSPGRVMDSVTKAMTASIQDDLGNTYVEMANPVGLIDSIHPEWYLTPVEPFKPGQPRPKSLKIIATVSASWYEYLPEIRSGTTHDLLTAPMALTIPLPETASPTDFDTRPVPHGIRLGDGRSSLALAAALARGRYYRNGYGGSNTQDRMAYWTNEIQEEAQRAPVSNRYRSLLTRELSVPTNQK